MKKIYAFLLSLLIAAVSLGSIDAVFQTRVKNGYYDSVGDIYGNTEKNQGLILQSISAEKGDNMLLYGSSDLGTQDIPSHPSNFFKGKKDGFQVNLIGRGHSQSLTHAINFGALSGDLKGKKVVFFVSPPWFENQGLGPDEFSM
jgi:D-alanine transfer protein